MYKSIEFDPSDHNGMLALMEKYGDSKFPYIGENENGERVFISISPDNITSRTHQINGWVRENVYQKDGYFIDSYEIFRGKWK